MKVEHQKITPALAKEWLLKRADFQRKLRRVAVEKYKMAILRDQWRENGDTIKFNTKGELIDGQHRLTAIAESGRSVRTLVVTNLPSGKETFATIDDMAARSLNDFMQCKNSNLVSAVIRHYWAVLNNEFPSPHQKPPISDLLLIAEPYTESIIDITAASCEAASISRIGGFFCFLMWYHTDIAKVPQDKVEAFISGVQFGTNLNRGDPRLEFRNRCFATKTVVHNVGLHHKITRQAMQAYLMKSFYAWVDGKEKWHLVWSAAREGFPALRTKKDIKEALHENAGE